MAKKKKRGRPVGSKTLGERLEKLKSDRQTKSMNWLKSTWERLENTREDFMRASDFEDATYWSNARCSELMLRKMMTWLEDGTVKVEELLPGHVTNGKSTD